MARKKINTTKQEIIRLATTLFLEKGYSLTSPRMICEKLDMSTGNLTYHFQTKEHLLAVLVHMLCDFQWKMMQNVVKEGHTSILAICMELTAMAAMCEEDEIAKDFYISAYSHPLTLEIIRKNDTSRARQVFDEYCKGWSEEQFAEAETIVSGIEYATLMTTSDSAPLDIRIAGALNSILAAYNVEEAVRKEKIDKVLSMDYRAIGKRVLKEFKEYVHEVNEHIYEHK